MSIIERSKVQPDRNLWSILREIHRRLRILERTHPGRPGSGPGQLAYWNADNEIETDENDANAGMYVPLGGIIMWSGAIASIPAGWALCDGNNGTPNLTDRFIVGAGAAYSPGDTGGADTNDLSHTHGAGTLGADSGGGHTHGSGTLGTDTQVGHTHGYGTLGTDTQSSHTHGYGTLATNSDTHTHGVDWNEVGIAYQPGGSAFQDPTEIIINNDSHSHTVNSGSTGSGGSHNHSVTSGATGSGGSHSHGVNSGATASDGAHTHTVSGASASAGSSTQENRPPYYALAFIMRIG